MKSIRRGQHLITLMLLLFLAGMAFLIWKLPPKICVPCLYHNPRLCL